MHLIEVRDVYKIYNPGENQVNALDGVSITIDEGEFVDTQRSLPDLMALLSARLPSSRPMAPRMMLLPAPVSPVMTEKPGYSLISSSSMSVKFLIYSCLSIIH